MQGVAFIRPLCKNGRAPRFTIPVNQAKIGANSWSCLTPSKDEQEFV